MNAREVLEALLQGIKMRRQCWNAECYIVIDGKRLAGNHREFELNASDWEIYRDTEKLKLGPEHVGRRVRLENGNIELITRYMQTCLGLEGVPCFQLAHEANLYNSEGKGFLYSNGKPLDAKLSPIIELLD